MRPNVELRLPAEVAYVSVLRATTVSLAARIDFTIDDIEDLRMAVGEACAVVLARAESGGELVASYYVRPGELTVSVRVPSATTTPPDHDGFAWQVLSALATTAESTADDGTFGVSLTMNSTVDA